MSPNPQFLYGVIIVFEEISATVIAVEPIQYKIKKVNFILKFPKYSPQH